jgi:predicted alpha-1,2-mannosidase
VRSPLLLGLIAIACKSSEDSASPTDAGTDTSTVESCYEAPTKDDRTTVVASAPLIQYVDPFIGTGGVGFGIGSTFPGPQVPYGMARPGPDTMSAAGASTFGHCVGYSYEDNYIYGFSQTRLHGIGIVDAGVIALMPVAGPMAADKTTEKGRRVTFSHKNEKASAGYYSVQLDNGTKVELTATPHVAYHRYTFASEGTLLLDIGHELPDVTVIDGSVTVDATKQEVSGFAHYKGGYSNRFGGVPMYFVARMPFTKFGTWKAGTLGDAAEQKGGDTGAYFTASGTVTVAVALSFVDIEHARKNLDAETTDFDAARKAAEAAWEKELSRVKIEARSARDLEIAYTALYHTLLMPTLGSDVDGSYRGLDNAVHTADYTYYTDFSLWDTYRTLHPFLTLVYPEHQLNFLKSMTAMAKDSGAPPKWPLGIGETGGMVGDSSAVVIAESYLKGLKDFDVKGAYDVLKKSATVPLPHDGRSNVTEYVDRGYIPIEAGGSSGSSTLEYAYDDYALSKLADALGEKADAELFRKHSGNWKNLWDAQSQMLLGRRKDGSFPRNDDMTAWQPYWAEGTSWHYTWFVPQDIPGLAEVMGGRDKFLKRLDEYFALSSCQNKTRLAPKPYYWHSNEPVLFVPWIYAELDEPQRGAQWIRWALENEYGDGPDGVPGNDDGGTMSAWYLFAGMGIFPRVGSTDYLLGTPIFPKTTLTLPGGTLTITAPDTSAKNMIPKSYTFNGAPLTKPRLEHAELSKGGALNFVLSSQ